MTFAPVFQRPFSATFDRRAAAAAASASWWLAGGAPTPVAVYQPKGAASLAASYVNLANPGTYDAAPGVAPTLGADGWTFNGSSQYLTTGGILLLDSYTVLVRFSGLHATAQQCVAGCKDSESPLRAFRMYPVLNATLAAYQIINQTATSAKTTSGVVGIAGHAYYINGSGAAFGATSPATYSWSQSIWIGCANNVGVAETFTNGSIQAVAIYSDTLTAGEVAAVSAAVALI